MMEYIPRLAEAETKKFLAQFPVVGIVGPRQVGKTTLAQHLARQLDRPTLYLDMEYPEDLNSLQDPAIFLERFTDHTIILDEVQRLPGLFPVLRSLVDRRRTPGRFILLGSATPEIIQASSETLAGRIAYVELKPFSIAELPEDRTVDDLWLRGGFPGSLLASDLESSLAWRRFFVQTYLERDLPMLGLRADPVLLQKLWTMLAHLNGRLFRWQDLSSSLDLHNTTVRRYVQFLESAFLIRILRPFEPNLTKRIVKSPKIYLRDTGILHQLLNIRSLPELLTHPALGASWEAFVLLQVDAHLPPGYELFFYRTQEGTEADLVIANGGVPEILVEIKFSSAPVLSRGFHIARVDLGTKKHFVIGQVSRNYPLKNGVEVIGAGLIPEMFR